MVCLVLSLLLACVVSLQACPEPLNVHIENYERPIILHTANCDNQLRNLGNQCLGTCGNQSPGTCGNQSPGICGNQSPGACGSQSPGTYSNLQFGYYGTQYKQPSCCEVECTCVSKQNYSPYLYGSVATYGGSGCCPVADSKPMVYCVCNSYDSNGYSNQGYQGYPNCQGKCSGC